MNSQLLELKFRAQHPSSLSRFSQADGGFLFKYWLRALPSEYRASRDQSPPFSEKGEGDEESADDHVSQRRVLGNSGRLRKMQSRPRILQLLLNGLGMV